MLNIITHRRFFALTGLVAVLGSTGLTTVGSVALSQTQTTTTHPGSVKTNSRSKKNFVQRHPHMTSAATGIVAYKLAKKSGQNRAAQGGKKNFAQRHPFMTGAAAALGTNHMIKKSNKK